MPYGMPGYAVFGGPWGPYPPPYGMGRLEGLGQSRGSERDREGRRRDPRGTFPMIFPWFSHGFP